jgi:hypothetical protein
MNLNVKRLEISLGALGFSRLQRQVAIDSLYFVRNSSLACLFDWIETHCSGRRQEAVGAYAGISVIGNGAPIKGLIENEILMEVAEDKERGWTEVLNDSDSIRWEQNLVRVAPIALQRLRERFGSCLLNATQNARRAAEAYLLRLQCASPEGISHWYEAHPERGLRQQAEDIAKWPGICHLPSGHRIYAIAIFVLLLWSQETENTTYSFTYSGVLAIPETQLLWRLQLLVDGILKCESKKVSVL